MEITYIKALQETPELHKGHPIRGWEESQVLDLEEKYNNSNPFPKAFREYLFLAGNWGGNRSGL